MERHRSSSSSSSSSRSPSDRGFALVTVLWIAGLLAVMTASLSLSARTNVRVAANLAENAKAEALADAGVTLAMLDLLAQRRANPPSPRFPVGGGNVSCSIAGEGTLRISLVDEAGKIDVNTATIPLLQALFVGLGEPAERAAQLAEAIFDYRDTDDERLRNGAERAEYQAAGIGWLPKNGPMQSLDELGQVFGMTPRLQARMRPYITVHTDLVGLDVSQARKDLISLLRTGLEGSAGAFGSFPEFHAAVALPAMFVSASHRRIFSLHIIARTSTGAVFVREAVVDLGPPNQPRRRFLRWLRGSSPSDRPSAFDGTVTPC
jgi:general secretion pathway protein K